MNKATFLFSAFFLCIYLLAGQGLPPYRSQAEFLDANDMKVYINSGGDLSWDLLGEPRFEVPKGSGKNCIFAGSPWIGGIDNSGQLRLAGQTYRQTGHDFWPGPVATHYDSAYFSRYIRVWKANKSEVLAHIANYNQPGYTMPVAIAEWPGNGDASNGEAALLAPFVDVNQNGLYEPQVGDYPDFPGDQALYLVYSDLHSPNTETGGEQTGLEIHTLAYVFDALPGEALDQTLFLNHRIVNRLGIEYKELMIGQWTDVDLGNFRDDYLGCDTSLNAYFVYNGDNDDEGLAGYGTRPPAVGFVYLNQKMDYFRSYVNDFGASGNPTTPTEHYGFLKNYWKDGSIMTYGANGMGGTSPSRYIFPGDPLDSSGWSEVTASIGPGDRRGIGSTGPFALQAGEEICVDMAIVFARADTGNNLNSVLKLKERIQEVHAFYDSTSHSCERSSTTAISDIEAENQPFLLYPNPANRQLFLVLEEQAESISFYDLNGNLIFSEKIQGVNARNWDISEWPPAMYLAQIQTRSGLWIQKIVKE